MSVSKTEMLKTAIQRDGQIDRDYHQIIKPLLDKLHREFINNALEGFKFSENSLKNFFDSYRKRKEEKKLNEQNVGKISEPLRKLLLKQFTDTARGWKKRHKNVDFKSNDWHILTGKAILKVLKKEHPEREKEIEKFDRFFTYLSRFNQTRENLYSAKGESTAIATRIIDDNLSFFIDNILIFEDKYKNVISEIPELKSRVDMFKLSNFSKYLLQQKIEEYQLEIGKINKAISEWRNKKASEDKKFKKRDYKLFTTLYRQLLTENTTEETEWDIMEDKQVTSRTWQLIDVTNKCSEKVNKFFEDFVNNFETGAWDLKRIYIPKRALNTITGKWFEDRATIEGAIADICGTKRTRKNKDGDKEEVTYKLPNFVSLDQIQQAIRSLEEGGAVVWRQKPTGAQEDYKQSSYSEIVGDKKKKNLKAFLEIFTSEFDGVIQRFDKAQSEIQKTLPRQIEYKKNSEKQKEAIVEIMRASLSVYQMFKYFHPYKGKDEDDRGANSPDEEFYGEYNDIRVNDDFDSVISRFNALRNHLSRKDYLQRKPWSRRDVELKWKLNFGSPSLLEGWDSDLESARLGVILKDENEYFLGVMHKNHNQIFNKKNNGHLFAGTPSYEKMTYKQLSGVYRQIPRLGFPSNKKKKDEEKELTTEKLFALLDKGKQTPYLRQLRDRVKKYGLTQELSEIKKDYDTIKKKDEFDRKKLNKLIEYYKKVSLSDFSTKYDLSGMKDAKFATIGEFNTFLHERTYSLDFQTKISKEYIDKKVNAGELYLFQIFNKDFSEKSRGNKNIHTIYFNHLFPDGNRKITGNYSLKLAGKAELFFRPATPNLKQEKIKTKSGKIIGENYSNKNKKYIQKERYTEDRYFFHCPITLNAQADAVPPSTKKGVRINFIKSFNEFARRQLSKKRGELAVLGLDRGEKQLLHYCLIKQDGTVIKNGNLNEIEHEDNKGNKKKVDYFAKLVVREAERDLARKDLRKIEGIKELKEGYLSHVIYKIIQLILEHKAIVVLEDLDKGFKRGRFKIERQTYQKFEKALIQKLNYLVSDKNLFNQKAGSVFNGYQLAAPFESFRVLSNHKQSGIIFYTTPGYTSKTDPIAGWRQHVYIGWSDTNKKIKNAFEKFEKIGWDEKKQSWIFKYNSKDFAEDGLDKPWELVADSVLTRLGRERSEYGKWDSKEVKPKELFDWIFDEKQWGIKRASDIKCQILKLDKENKLSKNLSYPKSDKKGGNFWQWFAYAWKLLCQIRNERAERYEKDPTKPKNEKGELVIPLLDDNGKLVVKQRGEDYMLSPVMSNGEHFDSRKGFQGKEWDGDANGAYNIARKGAMILKRIKENPENSSLFITKSDWDKVASNWDKFVQSKWTPLSKYQN